MVKSRSNRRGHIVVLLVITAALLAATYISISSVPAMGSWHPNKINTTTNPLTFIDTIPPIVSVTTPSAGTAYTTDTMPDAFSGTAKDNDGGAGLYGNSTTFILQRSSDFKHWDGDSWKSTTGWSPTSGDNWEGTLVWLSTSHDETACFPPDDGANCGSAEVFWTDTTNLPTWADDSYFVQARAEDMVGNISYSDVVCFYVDDNLPGDVDGNGEINVLDMTMIARIILGLEP
ncbi:hypothetical protein ACFLVX_05715 [Chloroflexota bacterium]